MANLNIYQFSFNKLTGALSNDGSIPSISPWNFPKWPYSSIVPTKLPEFIHSWCTSRYCGGRNGETEWKRLLGWHIANGKTSQNHIAAQQRAAQFCKPEEWYNARRQEHGFVVEGSSAAAAQSTCPNRPMTNRVDT